MNRFGIIAGALTLAGGIALRADDALPKAETILDHYIEVTGGKAAYEKRTSEVATGSFELPAMGVKGAMTRYSDSNNNSYTVIEIPGIGKMEQGETNGVAWEKSPMTGARVKSGVEKAEALRGSMFNGSLYWRKQYAKVETTGTAAVNSEDCYKVVLTPAEGGGKPETNYYSKKTGLLLKSETTVESQLGEVPAEADVNDYKDFGGVMTPAKITQKAAGQEFTITIDTVKVNEAIPADKFAIPDDVKALTDKPAAKPIDK
ncbi:MAG TPA: hypothetical protein VKS01_02770 [Bryobacteraceae bacterium]|nr:hypothetical protein [Bryobacteraceae bacterium]